MDTSAQDFLPTRRVGLVHDERFFWHEAVANRGDLVEPGFEFESARPRRRLLNLLHRSGLAAMADRIPARPLDRDDLLRVHTPAYLDEFARLSDESGGEVGELAGFGHGSFEIAQLAAGGVFEAIRATLESEVDVAYALVRPPGHHAERDRARGYCLLANIPLAIRKAQEELGLGRVAVIDWDVHHGNGTQSIFYDDPSVLAVSIHQDGLYPSDSGSIEERGRGDGEGTTINIPLPAGSGRGAYEHAFDAVIAPAVREFDPQLIVIACGFDASGLDPMGRMMLSPTAFGNLTARVMRLSAEVCGGRAVFAQEGGYSELAVPLCGAAVFSALLGVPLLPGSDVGGLETRPGQELIEHQAVVIARAVQRDVR